MLPILLVCLAISVAAFRCPDQSIDRFAALDTSKYYQCGGDGAEAELLECLPKGSLFDKELGECTAPFLVKRQSLDGYQSRVATGEIVELGNLFDVRKGIMYNGFNFWTKKTLANWTFVSEGGSSSTEFFVENDARDKTNHFDIGAQMELDFLSGLLSVKGSAQYLMDSQATQNTVRMVMKSMRVDSVLTLDSGAPMDFTEFCDMVNPTSGPTHLVVEVVRGQRIYFVFDKDLDSRQSSTEVKGELEAEISAIPLFSVNGNAVLHANGSIVENDESIKLKFYGDAMLESFPVNYVQAGKAYHATVDNAPQYNPISYSLAPISWFCMGENARTIVESITRSLTEAVTRDLLELREALTKTDTLLESDPAIRYHAIRTPLQTFRHHLTTFTNNFRTTITSMLPKIKSRELEEGSLVEFLQKYRGSAFRKIRSDAFLAKRKREIDAIRFIVSGAMKNPEISLSDISDAIENECIFKGEVGTAFVLKLLPNTDITERFLEEDGDWVEADAWFENDLEVKRIGDVKRTFEGYVDVNRDSPISQCFLIKLQIAADTEYDIKLSHKGQILTEDFQPPEEPPSPRCLTEVSGADFLVLASEITENPMVTGQEVLIEQFTETGLLTRAAQVVGHEPQFRIGDLEPLGQYRLRSRYRVAEGLGVSGDSDRITCTTRALSPPYLVRTDSVTATTAIIAWSRPQKIFAPLEKSPITYHIEVKEEGQIIFEDDLSETSLEITDLQPNSVFSVFIVATIANSTTEFSSLAAEFHFVTSLSAPPEPLLGDVENHAVWLTVSGENLPEGVEGEYVGVTYSTEEGEERSFTATLLQDEEFAVTGLAMNTTYTLRARILARVGLTLAPSDYSSPVSFTTNATIDSDLDQLNSDVADLLRLVDRQLGGMVERVNEVHGAVVEVINSTALNTETRIQELQGQSVNLMMGLEQQTNVAVRRGCVAEGAQYYSEEVVGKAFDIETIEVCLERCANQETCLSVYLNVEERICYMYSTPHGEEVRIGQENGLSSNLYCSSTHSARVERREQCHRKHLVYDGDPTLTLQGVGSVAHCEEACRSRERCSAISFLPWGGQEGQGGHGVQGKQGVTECRLFEHPRRDMNYGRDAISVNLLCFGVSEESVATCRMDNTTLMVSTGSVSAIHDSLMDCIDWCTMFRCQSVSFASESGTCTAHRPRMGTAIIFSEGWTSVNMQCLGVAQY